MLEPLNSGDAKPTAIGRLERLPLRDVWKHEAYDFTRWLQENIDVLNAATGLALLNVEREQAAGSFSIDLVAEDETGAKVIVENQLEKSNHDHLGKVLTYAVAMGAPTAVWIVADPRPEHVAVIGWLNEKSTGGFYLLKVEAVKIGTSAPAPLLTLITGPSAETEAVSRTNQQFAERHDIRKQWWTQLLTHPDAKLHKHITPSTSTWISVNSGVRGLSLNYVVLQEECAAELYIDRGNGSESENKVIFDHLVAHKGEIETAFGGPPLSWERSDNRRASRIRANVQGGYRSPIEEWEGVQAFQVQTMVRLNNALQPFIQQFRKQA